MTGSTGQSRPDPLALAVELAVYAPIGVAAYMLEVGPDVVRTVVARGRAEVDTRQEQVAGRVRHFKGAGQVAIAFGLPVLRKKVEKRLASLRPDPAPPAPVKRPASRQPPAAPPAAPSSPAASNGHHVDTNDANDAVDKADNVVAAPVTIDLVGSETAGETTARAESEGRLAIPGYDALSASQVVERLAGLSGDELAAVRQYEADHRRRRTILGKIEQLSA
jgi:hypothetical protein